MNFKNYSLALLLLLLSVNFIFSQGLSILSSKEKGIESNYYFHSPDGIAKFNISTSKIAMKFDEKISEESLDKLKSENPELKNLDYKSLHKLAGYSIVNINSKISKSSDLEKITTKLKNLNEIVFAQPLFIYEDGTEQIATEKIMVKLFNKSDLSQLQKDALKFNFTISDSYAYDDKVYFINVNPNSTFSSIDIANSLAQSKKYSTAEPIFVKLLERMNTNDPFLSYQWALNNTGSSVQYNGTPGSDMNVLNAWGISTGSNTIKVAIIDEGVDLNHPDLVANLLPGFDATGQGSGGGPQGNDAHGTACAGIVAASANNNIGIAGVAYNTKIVPVRIAYSNGSNWVTNDTWISTAIDWAWNQGQADVLSNSWGGGSPSTLINDAIGRAVTQGRANKGAAVLFAAGNNNGAVSYPATNVNTISVIAMSMCNQRKSPTSCDNETWWGSNYGLNADIAAPGVKIYTTDISGVSGYEAGDYESTFNGTSSACPNAAGVMALILSVNPNLTYTQARQILESTCEKTGGYPYNGNVSGQPNGTWSADLGYGRVNAFAALQLASGFVCSGTPVSTTTLASHNNLCAPANVTFTLQTSYPLSGTTYQWEESIDGNNYTNVSGATNNFYVSNITSSKWFRCVITCIGSVTSTPVLVNYLDQTIYTYPHTQNFNSSNLPCGWSVQNVNNDNFTWAARTTGPRTPSYGMSYLKNPGLAANDWFFSPPLNMVAGTNYAVRFWYRGSSVTLPEKLEVKWGNANIDGAMTSSAIFSNSNILSSSYQVVNSAVISPTSSGIYYVGFRVFSSANMSNLLIDDITFEIVAPCNVPLQGGTISGPSTIEAGNSTISSWGVTGQTGNDIQWQISANNGSTWSNMSGLVVPTINTYIPVPGNYLLRVKVGSLNCPDAYSNPFALNVIPRVGDVFSNPIIASGLYEEYLNTGSQSGFNNDYTGPNAQPSNDVFFRYTTGACVDSLMIGTCGSAFDTYVHILDANGIHLFSIDDGPLCGQTPVFTYNVNPNTVYYVVLEGWNTSQGEGGIGFYEILHDAITASITPSGSTTICEGENLTLTASNSSSYLWSNGANTSSIIVTIGGIYSVTVSDVNGCTAIASIAVTSFAPTTVWFQDADGDSFGNINITTLACNQPSGYVSNNTDCDDNNPAVNTLQQYYIDADGDGFGSTTTAMLCSSTAPNGYSINNTDCDDNNSAINALQQYFVDADGDGFGSTTTAMICSSTAPSGYSINNTDCDDNNSAINALQQYFVDTDGDGFGSTTTAMLCSSTAPSGYSTNNTDCDDNNAAVNALQQYYLDADNDGYGSTTTAMLCSSTAPSGYSTNNTDCDDNNAAVNALQQYYLDADNDGYGSTTTAMLCSSTAPSGYSTNNTDCDDNNAAVNALQQYYLDADNDGYGSTTTAMLCSSTPPSGYSTNNTDCDDNDAAVNALQQYYLDADNDGYGSTTTAMLCSSTAPSGYSTNNTDCDDNNATVNALQQYYLDADNDGYGSTTTAMLCSSTAPSGYSTNNTDCDDNNANVNLPLTWYQDVDGDGYGQIELTTLACTQPTGYVSDFTDCNDNDALIHSQNIFYSDMDEDGYGGSVVGSFCLLTPPDFWSANDEDCNDNNTAINPNTVEICGNNIDDNCNGSIDESCCGIVVTGVVTNAMCSNVPNGSINVSVSNAVAPFTFLWSNNATSEDINNLSLGTYSITVTDNTGCTGTGSFVVNHNNQAPIAATAIAGPSGACRNQTNVIFSVTPITGATSYIWTLPNGASGTSTTNSISLNFSNNYNTGNLCVKAVNDCGQSANYCRQVLRYTNAPAVPGTISGLSKGVCPNTTYSYSIAAVNNATSYIWTAPNNATIVSGQGTTNVTVSFGANFGTNGTLSVRSSNCIGNSNNRNLTIQRNPAQPSTITGPSPVCKNQQGIVYSVTNVPEYTYNWVVPNGCTIVSGQGTNSVTVNWGTNSGSIAVQSVVSCAVSSYRSRSITANTCDTAPVIIENELALTSLFEVYPNPNNGNTKIYLNTEKESNYQVDVLNMQGQLIKRLVGNTVRGDNYFDVDITNTMSGIYYIKYSDTNGLLHTRTVIKE